MEAVLYVIGALWIIAGTLTVLYTESSREWFARLTKPIPLKALAFVPIVMGGLLMLAAPASHTFWLVEAVGVLAVLKGLLLLLIPREQQIAWLFAWWRERASDVTWRFAGLLGVILGVFIVLRL
jgi:uncharacterized membrane protein HdeD (DUF308 family)